MNGLLGKVIIVHILVKVITVSTRLISIVSQAEKIVLLLFLFVVVVAYVNIIVYVVVVGPINLTLKFSQNWVSNC